VTEQNALEQETPAPVSLEVKPESRHTARLRSLRALQWLLKRADAGTLARLRRGDSRSPPPDFFRVSVDLLDEVLPEKGERRDREESRWAVLVSVIAIALGTTPQTGGLLGSVPFGRALARAGVAEMRVLRLLEADDDQIAALVRHLVHQLVSKGQPFSLNDLADLVLDNGTERCERARRSIARDFYRHDDGN
jgi:CRISPR type I-E-associated protein CasB/Cse2